MSADPSRRVAVTGLGIVCPIGTGRAAFWKAALEGRVGTGEVTQFDTSTFLTHRAGEVRGFEPARWLARHASDELPRPAQLAVAASRMAVEDARFDPGPRATRVGVVFGTVLGNRPAIEAALATAVRAGGALPTLAAAVHDVRSLVRAPAAELGLAGPTTLIATACAAGNSAISHGMDLIRDGRADAVVAGGVDGLSPTMFMMFNRFAALSPDVVRPFDRRRKGLLLAEGAAALLLERLDLARARGATIYAEVVGHGNFTDAHHMTAPHPEGLGAVRSMRAALAMAGALPGEVGYVCAHGTGTQLNDVIEARAIRQLLGEAASRIPVSSIKAMTGHTQGAASAVEAVACVLAIHEGVVPPTANCEEPDPECAIDVVALAPRRCEVRYALNNAFGFGGNTSCVLFARASENESARPRGVAEVVEPAERFLGSAHHEQVAQDRRDALPGRQGTSLPVLPHRAAPRLAERAGESHSRHTPSPSPNWTTTWESGVSLTVPAQGDRDEDERGGDAHRDPHGSRGGI